jgi:hypothetical protein
MAHSTNAKSSFPAKLHIPFSSDRFFNHKKFNNALQEQFGCTLSYCSVEIGSHLDKLALGESEDADGDASSQYKSVEDVEPDRERLIDLGFLNKLRIKKCKQSGNGEASSRKKRLGFPSLLLFPACFLVTMKNWRATVRNQQWNGTNPFFQLEFIFATICERSLGCI